MTLGNFWWTSPSTYGFGAAQAIAWTRLRTVWESRPLRDATLPQNRKAHVEDDFGGDGENRTRAPVKGPLFSRQGGTPTAFVSVYNSSASNSLSRASKTFSLGRRILWRKGRESDPQGYLRNLLAFETRGLAYAQPFHVVPESGIEPPSLPYERSVAAIGRLREIFLFDVD